MFFVHGATFLIRLCVAIIVYKPHAGVFRFIVLMTQSSVVFLILSLAFLAAEVLSRGSFESHPFSSLTAPQQRHQHIANHSPPPHPPPPLSAIIDTVRTFCTGAAPFPVTALFKLAMCVAQASRAVFVLLTQKDFRSPTAQSFCCITRDAGVVRSLEWDEDVLSLRQRSYVEKEVKMVRVTCLSRVVLVCGVFAAGLNSRRRTSNLPTGSCGQRAQALAALHATEFFELCKTCCNDFLGNKHATSLVVIPSVCNAPSCGAHSILALDGIWFALDHASLEHAHALAFARCCL